MSDADRAATPPVAKADARTAARRRRAVHRLDATDGPRLAAAAGAVPGPPCSAVAAFVPLADEPPVLDLLARLAGLGRPVWLPVLRADRDLDWAPWIPGSPLEDGLLGTRQSPGRRLGVGAVARCGAVLVPAVAVDLTGRRLGRGGGSYDRALARLPAGVARVAVVLDEDVCAEPLPVEAHDQPVQAVLTPRAGIRWLAAPTQPDPTQPDARP